MEMNSKDKIALNKHFGNQAKLLTPSDIVEAMGTHSAALSVAVTTTLEKFGLITDQKTSEGCGEIVTKMMADLAWVVVTDLFKE